MFKFNIPLAILSEILI